MPVPSDPTPALQAYADPQRLVTTEWLAENLGAKGLVVIESDEDVLLYETGHIPGAVKVDWHLELNDQVTRDYLNADGFAELCAAKGIGRDDTIVFYGDNFNWWAAYALWVFSLFGHGDVRLLNGGRQKWIAEGRELTRDRVDGPRADYPVPQRDDSQIRAYRDEVAAHIASGRPLVDVRSPGEYSGELLHMPDYPQEGAMRGGHIPGAVNKPWKSAANDDGTFKRRRPAPGDLRRRAGALHRGRHHRLLPDRRAVQPHLVRAAPPARLPARPQLRRLVDRVGQPRPRPHRPRRPPRRPGRLTP